MPTRWCECHLVSQHILQDRLFLLAFTFLFSELFINELIWEIQGKKNKHVPAMRLYTNFTLQVSAGISHRVEINLDLYSVS